MDSPVSSQMQVFAATIGHFLWFMTESAYARRSGDPGICDFVTGNPQEPAHPGFVAALQRWSVPQNKDWFAYTLSNPRAQATVAATLRERRGIAFEPDDILMTTGAFGALAVSLRALVEPGDEVIFISPPWFFYEVLIMAAGATPVRVKMHPETFDLDLDAIAAAITPRTRAILVNSPHNPTGKIYPPETLERLASLLATASERNGRAIYLLSDESYSRIVFDGRPYHSPTAVYPRSLLIYTYGKALLIPGQRIGYVALSPAMPDRETVRLAITMAQVVNGYLFPNALLQHALPDFEPLSIDIAQLQRRRDRVVAALQPMGYKPTTPEGTFYVMAASPWQDDLAFSQLLAEYEVFVLPGTVVEMPGYFRISLTGNDEMVERALPGFAAAMTRARAGEPVSSQVAGPTDDAS